MDGQITQKAKLEGREIKNRQPNESNDPSASSLYTSARLTQNSWRKQLARLR